MWTHFFDKIYLINLPERKARLSWSSAELAKYKIDFEIFIAIKHKDGREGLYLSVKQIFENAIIKDYKRILVFEDDIRFVRDPTPVMDKCIEQLPVDFDMFYLGCNIPKPVNSKFTSNLIPIQRALSTHAVAYSKNCMEKVLALPKILPIDSMLANKIHPLRKSFCAYPLLATQRPAYSDIERRIVDWKPFIEHRYAKHTKHLE